MVRTTISLPEDFHEELLLLAVKTKKSLGQLVFERFKSEAKKKKKLSVEEQIKRDFALFDKIAKSGKQIDLIKALKEQREERDKKLMKYL